MAPVVVVLGCARSVTTAADHGLEVSVPLYVAVPVEETIWYPEAASETPPPESVHGEPGLVIKFPAPTAPTQNSLAVAVVPVVPDE